MLEFGASREYLFGRPGPPLTGRARTLFEEHRLAIHRLLDGLFAFLLVFQFGLALVLARALPPSGGADPAAPHGPLWLAFGLGAALSFVPLWFAIASPGRALTRHTIAAAQLGFSALFIQLTSGGFQTHYHIFGSLALLAFYRDWRVFLTATAVIMLDHVARPLFWPGSMPCPEERILWSGIELVLWMLLVNAFLISGCPRAIREMQGIARQRAALEETNQTIEAEVRRQTAALSTSEAQYRTLFDSHPFALWVYDEQTLAILNANDAAVTGYGYSRAEFMGMAMTDISPAGAPRSLPLSRAGEGPGEVSVTLHKKKDGLLLDVEVIEFPFVFLDRPVRLMAAQDVTRRLRAEKLIAVQQAVTRELAVSGSLQDAAPAVLSQIVHSLKWDFGVLWLVDAAGEHLDAFHSVMARPGLKDLETALSGFRPARGQGLAGRTWLEGKPLWVAALDDDRLSTELATIAEKLDLKTLLSVPVVGGERVVGVLQFLSRADRMDDLPMVRSLEAVGRHLGQYIERKRLEERHHLMADIVEASTDAIYAVDVEGRVLSWNQGARQLFGYAASEIVGQPITRLAPAGRAQEVREMIDLLLAGGTVQHHEATRVRKDGSNVLVHASAAPIRDSSGQTVGMSVVARDISEEKRLQTRLQQAQRLEAIGELAAGIAHEINTPTQYVGDNVQFLGRAFDDLNACLSGWEKLLQGPDAPPLAANLREQLAEVHRRSDLEFTRAEVPLALAAAQDGISRISQIVGAMKEFSHPGMKEKAPTDLNRAIQSTITVARGEWKHHADVVTDLDPELPAVHCRGDEVNQVILNLVVNAAHAIRDARPTKGNGKGAITISTRAVEAGVEIRVSDTGTGIPEAIRTRVYDPFFTTKGVGKGTGQGLAIAHDVVVVKHGGAIEFDSEVGVGTTFTVTLPVCGAPGCLEEAA